MKFDRRSWLGKSGAAALAAASINWGARARGDSKLSQRDRFGGWQGIQLDATGYFRVEKTDRWWLVTPDGHPFLSLGINHLYPDLWNQDFSRASWQERLGVEDLNDWQEFAPALRKWFLQTCDEFGFNTVGVHNSLQVCNQPRPVLPYMRPIRFVDIPHWRKDVDDDDFVDIFSDSYLKHCDELANEMVVPVREDPYLLGYAMTDCPLFTDEDCRERTDVIGGARREARIGWPKKFRNMPSSAPGKQAYVECMREIYHDDVVEFNTTYDTSFHSFSELTEATQWRSQNDLSNPSELRDNLIFLHRVVERYYATARAAIRRYDPNHLFFGDKINANTNSMDSVFRVTSKYTDVAFYQMYARYEVQEPALDRWAKIADLPFINGDSAFTMVTEHMPRPYGPIADTLEQRAEWTDEFFRKAFSRPDFVGWHYCGLIDATMQVARKQARQHSGLLDAHGVAYPQLRQVMKRGAQSMYETAVSKLG